MVALAGTEAMELKGTIASCCKSSCTICLFKNSDQTKPNITNISYRVMVMVRDNLL